MIRQPIITCDECNGAGCMHCDHQGSWQGDWRCRTCDTLIGSEEGYCPSCEEVTTCYAGDLQRAGEAGPLWFYHEDAQFRAWVDADYARRQAAQNARMDAAIRRAWAARAAA